MRRTSWLALALALIACGDDDAPVDAGHDAGQDVGQDVGTDAGTDAFSFPDAGWTPSGELGFEADPPGQWYAGDFHVHATGASNDTGGDSFPDDIKRVALERGLHFVVLTDHSNSTGSDPSTTDEDPELFNMGPEFPLYMEAAMLSEPGVFLMIDGNEISPVMDGERPTEPTGHVGCSPMDLATFDYASDAPFIDRPRGTVTGGEGLAQALDRGCFTVLNHPYASAPWTAFDWTPSERGGAGDPWGYHAIEVWNGTLGFGEDDRQAYDAWRCDRLAGRAVTPIGASDNHRVNEAPPGQLLDPALGYPRTDVYARELTWPALIEALLAGQVRIGEGGSTLTIDMYDEDGARAEDGSARWLRIRATLDPILSSPAELRVTRATGCTDPRPAPLEAVTVEEQVLVAQPIVAGELLDVAIPIAGEPGLYSAIIDRRHHGAISRGIRIE